MKRPFQGTRPGSVGVFIPSSSKLGKLLRRRKGSHFKRWGEENSIQAGRRVVCPLEQLRKAWEAPESLKRPVEERSREGSEAASSHMRAGVGGLPVCELPGWKKRGKNGGVYGGEGFPGPGRRRVTGSWEKTRKKRNCVLQAGRESHRINEHDLDKTTKRKGMRKDRERCSRCSDFQTNVTLPGTDSRQTNRERGEEEGGDVRNNKVQR